jgi:uncharacterized membrane protein
MKGAGYPVDVVRLALYAIPIVAVSLGVAAVQFVWLERQLGQRPDETADHATAPQDTRHG